MKSILSAVLVLLAAGTVACTSGESPTTPDGVGTYTLVKVNGSTLPVVTVQNATVTQEFTGAQLTLNANGTFTETRTGRITLAGGNPSPITGTQTGSWVLSGGKIDFVVLNAQGNPSGTFSGTWTQEHITYSSGGLTLEYTMLEHA